jgi:hypothetical protein
MAEQAEEVAAPTDPKTLAKIAVTEAIRNATIKDFDGENFVINGKTSRPKASVCRLSNPSATKMALEQMMARVSAMQTEELSREPSKTSTDASMPGRKILGSTNRNRKKTRTTAKPHQSIDSVSPMSCMERP